jgi:hypothetical protein
MERNVSRESQEERHKNTSEKVGQKVTESSRGRRWYKNRKAGEGAIKGRAVHIMQCSADDSATRE